MKGARNPVVASDGVPFLGLVVVAMVLAWQYGGISYALMPLALLVFLFLVFRDPPRDVPAIPLAVVSPVDGTVVEIGVTDRGALDGEAHVVRIRVNTLGAYTARCPTEGKLMDLRTAAPDGVAAGEAGGLWIRTDEDDDVLIQFSGNRFGIAPLALSGYGERVGQGQRCAYLRLTRFAEVQLPLNSRVLVAKGQRVSAGIDVLAMLPHR